MAERIRKCNGISYEIIRAKRKTIAVQISKEGMVIVKAPERMPVFMIEDFVMKHREWILKHQEKLEQMRESAHVITDAERKQGIKKAHVIFPQRAAFFAERMGVSYGRITIREQKTRWGSCSAAGNLNFNWKLVLMPEEVLDYVVVHELAHRRVMDHSAAFWKIVEKEMPDFQRRRKLLRKYEKMFI
ncbi:MAG: M48 family metallopeptidase [Clostridiales bacterium]|nr:M48 family metallopeptidase [Candidatus Blautia equi]